VTSFFSRTVKKKKKWKLRGKKHIRETKLIPVGLKRKMICITLLPVIHSLKLMV